MEEHGVMRTNKTLEQLDPAITISPVLLECRCNYQLLRVRACVSKLFACTIRITTEVHTVMKTLRRSASESNILDDTVCTSQQTWLTTKRAAVTDSDHGTWRSWFTAAPKTTDTLNISCFYPVYSPTVCALWSSLALPLTFSLWIKVELCILAYCEIFIGAKSIWAISLASTLIQEKRAESPSVKHYVCSVYVCKWERVSNNSSGHQSMRGREFALFKCVHPPLCVLACVYPPLCVWWHVRILLFLCVGMCVLYPPLCVLACVHPPLCVCVWLCVQLCLSLQINWADVGAGNCFLCYSDTIHRQPHEAIGQWRVCLCVSVRIQGELARERERGVD